ncbi:MAG: thermonuclease family protein [Candidatus Omnitrophica bacterium]|nr:thermonuclease family protein [Candidatus Omnitrophota bacterium]
MDTKREAKDLSAVSGTYALLRKQIRGILAQAQERIEREKVETYWQMGRLIHEHILHHKDRADYGKKVIVRLQKDLSVHETVLRRTIQFYEAFPIHATWRKLSWSHFRALLSVEDDQKRIELAKKADANNWTVQELEAQIRKLTSHKKQLPHTNALSAPLKLKTPILGPLHHYQIKNSENLHWNRATLLVDLGFTVYAEAERFELQKIKEGDIVASVKEEHDIYNVKKAKEATRDSLFTYKAFVERVIDGDTLKLQIDLGFGVWTRQVIRLRGLDAPEIGTKKGMRAKRFLETELGKTAFVLLKSTRSDKYDRYLGDLFTETGEYLNQKLLDAGFARVL